MQIKLIGIETIFHIGGPSYDIVSKFKKLVSIGAIDLNKLRIISINYNTTTGDSSKGPVRLYFTDGLAVYLNLTAGYSGSGPTDLCEILNFCKVEFNKDDITSHQDVVEIKYTLDGSERYQFCLPDGDFLYTF